MNRLLDLLAEVFAAWIMFGIAMSLLALLGLGCAVPEPDNVEVAAPAGAEDAAAIVVQEWSERLPHAGRLDVDDLPPVRWFEGPCLDYGDATECILGSGRWTPLAEEIHLLVRDSLADTSLTHELLHWSLNQTGAGRDGDHTSRWWTQVDEIDAILRRAGL